MHPLLKKNSGSAPGLWTFPTLVTGEISHEINKMRNKINEHYFPINSFILQALMFYLAVTL